MSYGRILAILSGAADDADTLAVAAGLAGQHGAVARALAAFPKVAPVTWSDAYGLNYFSAEVWDAIAAGEQDLRRRGEELVRAAAERAGLAFGPGPGGGRLLMAPDAPTTWTGLLRELPLTDLVVAGHSCVKEGGPFVGVLDAALMDCRAPLLVVRGPEPVGQRGVAVAWDGSLQAGRALRAAVPLLRHAGSVVVLQDPERLDDEERSHADPQEVLEYLQLRGVGPVAVERIMGEGPGVGLAQVAAGRQSGVLVAGAYGHARLAEALFGGATRALLAGETGPHVFIAH